jgi:hypothetical protein
VDFRFKYEADVATVVGHGNGQQLSLAPGGHAVTEALARWALWDTEGQAEAAAVTAINYSLGAGARSAAEYEAAPLPPEAFDDTER